MLPPLDALEKVMFRLIGTGFVILTLALLTGFVFVTNLRAQHLEHKTILSLHRLGVVRRAAHRPHTLRLARPAAVLWTLSGFGFPDPVVFRLEVRARVSARTALGLTQQRGMPHPSLSFLFCALGVPARSSPPFSRAAKPR